MTEADYYIQWLGKPNVYERMFGIVQAQVSMISNVISVTGIVDENSGVVKDDFMLKSSVK